MRTRDGGNPNAGRRTRRYMKQRDEFRTRCEAEHRTCHLCGQPIDYSAPHVADDGFQVDHFHPVSERPDLAEDMANFRPSHKSCNVERGNKRVQPTIGVPSRDW